MRLIDSVTKERLEKMNQTLYENAQPSMEVMAIRPRTPIFHKNFWQENIVAEAAVTDTSVAIQRSANLPETAWVAYVSGGTLYVKKSDFTYPVDNMAWIPVFDQVDVSKCALEFGGHFVQKEFKQVEYLTDEWPWLFYTTTAGVLYAYGDTSDTVAASVTDFDAIRGVASIMGDMDQGMLVFYIVGGAVYYKQYLDGEWGDQQTVSLAPANAVSIHAERTFDWRIVLQVMTSDGTLYEIFTKPEASGHACTEFITMTAAATSALIPLAMRQLQSGAEYIDMSAIAEAEMLYGLAPVMVSVRNILLYGSNWGEVIEVKFNVPVSDTSGQHSQFLLTGANNYTANALGSHQPDDMTFWILFEDFNNAENPLTLSYIQGTIRGDVELVESGTVEFTAENLIPTNTAPAPVSAEAISADSLLVIYDNELNAPPAGDEAAYTVTSEEPQYTDGPTVEVAYPVDSVEFLPVDGIGESIDLLSGTLTNIATATAYTAAYIPAMSGNSAPSPFVASASTTSSGDSAGPYQAFDGSYNTIWHSTYPLTINESTPQWLKIRLDAAIKIWKYHVTARNSGSYVDYPAAWVLQGSNDDSSWDDLDTQSVPSGWTPGGQKSFEITPPATAYLYYRLKITSGGRNGSGNQSFVVAAEFNIYLYG